MPVRKSLSLKLKTFISVTFLLLALTVILAACGSSSSSSGTATTTATASSSSSTASTAKSPTATATAGHFNCAGSPTATTGNSSSTKATTSTGTTGNSSSTKATTSTGTTGQNPHCESTGSGNGSNARSQAAAGGSTGTVSSVSTSGFTMSTPTNLKVTVKEASSTTYQNGTSSTSASAITKGESVLVLGTANGTTITATQVIVQPTNASKPSTAAEVIPFEKGKQSPTKHDGQIPANYSEGDGTIVSGTTATQATEAALAAYPGGVVDRVVKLSNGEYEVHNIGVNWPHHIFVNQDFKVVGAE